MIYENYIQVRVREPKDGEEIKVLTTLTSGIEMLGNEDNGDIVELHFPSDRYDEEGVKLWLEKNNIKATSVSTVKAFAEIATKDIRDIKVFETGEWNDVEHSDEDIKQLVEDTNAAIKEQGHTVAVWLGHDEADSAEIMGTGEPAVGWVENIRRKGKAIFSDFVRIPQKVYDWIKAGLYRRVSIGYVKNMKIGDKVYNKVITHIALLGAKSPAVSTSADLLKLFGLERNGVEFVTWDIDDGREPREDSTMDKTIEAIEAENKELKAKLEAEAAEKAKAEKERQETEQRLMALKQEQELKDIKAFVASLTEGDEPKVPPAYSDALVDVLLSVPADEGEKTFTVGEEKTKSPREAMEKFLSGLGVVMKFEEKAKTEDSDEADGKDAEAKIMAAVNKVLEIYGVKKEESDG